MTTTTLRSDEVRTFPALRIRELAATDDRRWLEGRAVPYGDWTNVGWYLEQFQPGAFEKSTNEAARGLPLLMWHNNRTWPVGVSDSWTHDSEGMDGVWRMDKSDEAERAVRMAAEGFLVGLSVGFTPIHSEWEMAEDWDPEDEDHMDRVVRTEARLHEVSLTPTPAYAGAEVTLVRSLDRSRIAKRGHTRARSEIDHWRTWLNGVRRS